jgi:hypothetical protein
MPVIIKNRIDKMGFEAPTEIFVRNNATFIKSQIVEVLNRFDFINNEILVKFDSFVKKETNYDEIFFRLFSLNRFLHVYDI